MPDGTSVRVTDKRTGTAGGKADGQRASTTVDVRCDDEVRRRQTWIAEKH
jgi:hypothetical protein